MSDVGRGRVGARRVLWRGGRVWSPVGEDLSALLVVGDVVAWVGREAEASTLVDSVDGVVELRGALVTPAFVDAHVHTTATGLVLRGLDLAGCRSGVEVLERFAAYARAHPGEVVIGQGWDDAGWAVAGLPSAAELERAAPGVWGYLVRVDGHAALASAALLAQARGRSAEAAAVLSGVEGGAGAAGGVAGSPRAGGTSAGLGGAGSVGGGPVGGAVGGAVVAGWPLRGEAHHVVREVALGALRGGQRREAQRAALRHAASLGIGVVHEMAGPRVSGEDDLGDLVAVAGEGVGAEVVAYWGEAGAVRKAAALGAVGCGGDLYVDGSLGACTARVVGGYGVRPRPGVVEGLLFMGVEEVAEHVVACAGVGMQPGFHVIGDAAVEVAVAGLERAARVVGWEVVRRLRPRLEHAEMVGPGLWGRLRRLGVVASVQPGFDAAWGGRGAMYAARLGWGRAEGMNPVAGLVGAGVGVAFGSDAPVTALGPWEAVRAAVWHHVERHRVPVEVAVEAHTRGGWVAARGEGRGASGWVGGLSVVGESGVGGAGGGSVSVGRVRSGGPWGSGADGLSGVLVPGAVASFAVWEWAGDVVGGLPVLACGGGAPVCRVTVVRGRVVFGAGRGG